MEHLLGEIRACQTCVGFLPNPPKPILFASKTSKIAIIGQAPGNQVHQKEIGWADKSGDTLRDWMGIDEATFYNEKLIASIPMGFCYPGTGKSGDLPPRKECAPQWHEKVLAEATNIKLILLIGTYAQKYYLGKAMKKNLTETVKVYDEYLPKYFPIVHPSPLNFRWHSNNPWFKDAVVPSLRVAVRDALS